MDFASFKILLVILVIAYKLWEFFRTKLKSPAEDSSRPAEARPLPPDLDQLPWEETEEPLPRPGSTPSAPSYPGKIGGERMGGQELSYSGNAPSIATAQVPSSLAKGPEGAARAELPAGLKGMVLAQVILGKPLALDRARFRR